MDDKVHLGNLCESIQSALRRLPFASYMKCMSSFCQKMCGYFGDSIPEEASELLRESLTLVNEAAVQDALLPEHMDLFVRWDRLTDNLVCDIGPYYLCLTVAALSGEISGALPVYSASETITEPLSRLHDGFLESTSNPEVLTYNPNYLSDRTADNIQLLFEFESILRTCLA